MKGCGYDNCEWADENKRIAIRRTRDAFCSACNHGHNAARGSVRELTISHNQYQSTTLRFCRDCLELLKTETIRSLKGD